MAQKKFKAHANLSNWAKDWDGGGDKVKLRVPTEGGNKVEVLIVPGDVLGVSDAKTQKALEQWTPPPITIDGSPWQEMVNLFTESDETITVDLDE